MTYQFGRLLKDAQTGEFCTVVQDEGSKVKVRPFGGDGSCRSCPKFRLVEPTDAERRRLGLSPLGSGR